MGRVSREQALEVMAKLATNADWDELDSVVVQEIIMDPVDSGHEFTRFLANRARMQANQVSFRRDMRKEGWKLLENVGRRINSISDLELVSFLKSGEDYINGEEMLRRARELDANYSQEDAEWLLEHQNEIPVEMRKYYIVFTGTVWQGSYGYLRVPCLYWFENDRCWCLNFPWLGDGWYSFDRLPRLRK